jgi:ubiquinone/menaquinone biosynthesis C-methylase UbiE
MKTTEERKKHWEYVYQTRSPNDVSWYQTHPESSLKLIEKSLSNKSMSCIDVGGGASVLVDHLIKAGFTNLSVLDISEQALQHTKERLKEKSEQVQWYISDILTFKTPHKFDLWHDRAVFHFLTDSDERKRYVKILKESLNNQGQVIIATFGINGPEKCSDLPIKQHDTTTIMEELGNEFTLLETFDEYHLTPKNIQQKFSYFHFIFNQGAIS